MKYYKIYENIQPQLIKGENISLAAQFCITGNTQVGFLALASIFSPNMINKGYYYLIDNKTHNSLRQAYIITKKAKDNTVAHDFAKFIESKEARVIFEKYGFTLE